MPRFDMAAAAAIITKVQGMFKKAGVEMGAAFGADAQAGLRVMQAELIRTENQASRSYINMKKAAGDYQIAKARYDKLIEAGEDAKTDRMIRAQTRYQTALAKGMQMNKEYALQQAAAIDAQAAVAAKQTAIGEAAIGASAARMNAFGAAATGTLLLIGAKSVDAAGKYEASLTKIQSTTGESADAIKKLGDGLLQLGPQVGYSAQELQNAAFLLAKSRVGFNNAEEQLKVLKAAAQLAKVEGADLTDVMNGLTTTMVDFHVPAEKAADVASQLRVTVGAAKAPLDQFMGALHNFEPIMKVITEGGGDAASSIGQVGSMLAMMTQNGMSADQASQNLRNTLLHLIDPSGPQRNIMGQLGLTPDALSKELSDPNKGPIGVMKEISDRIAEMAGDTNHVVLDAMYKNPQATANMNTAFSHLTGQSLAFAQSINNGVMPPMKDLHKQMKLDPELAQWMQMRQKVEGFSDTLKKNQDLVRTLPQIFKNVTGTDQGMMVFSQLFGDPESANKTIELWHEASKAKADANGNVEGTGLVTETYKFKLDQAKASWHSLTIQMGEAFLPTAKVVMDALAKTAEFLTNHQGIMRTVITVLEALAARWLFLKAQMVIGPLVSGIAKEFGVMLTAASNTYDKITGKAKQSAEMSAKAAQESAEKQVTASQQSAAKQVEAQDKVAANAQASAGKQTAAAEANAAKTAEVSTVSTTKQVEDQAKIAVAGEKTNTVIGSQRAVAADTGALAVNAASEKEVLAEGRVAAAAEKSNGSLSRGGGLLSGAAFLGTMMLPGGDQGRDTVNNLATGAAILGGAPVAIPAVAGAALYDASVANNDRMTDEQNIATQRAIVAAGGHAAGGPISGSGPKGKDSVLMWGAPGEHVLTADEVDKLGGHNAVYALRAAVRGYDTGGAVGGSPGYGNFSTLTQWLSQFQGGKYNNDTGDDCSGITSQIVNVAMGRPALESKMTTRDAGPWLAARGFKPGYKGIGAINVGWYNHGNATQDGHMAVTLPDGVHAEMGGGHNFLLGPGAVGADSSQFDQHMYLPIAGFVGAPGTPGSTGTQGSPYANGGAGSPSLSGSFGVGSGGSGGSGGGEQDLNPFNALSGGFTLANIAKFATMFLANLALGNPIGRMEAARRTGGQLGTIGVGGLAGASSNLPTSLSGIEADQQRMKIENARNNAVKAIDKYGEGSPQAEKALNGYRTALENAEKNQIKANENVGKYGTKLEELNARLEQQQTHLKEQQANSDTKPSAIAATQNAIDKTQHQIDATLGKVQANAAKAASSDSAYYDSLTNGEIPRWEDWGYTGGGGLGPVFKRGGGSPAPTVPDIAPTDHADKDKVLPMNHGRAVPLGDAPATAIPRSAFDALKDAPHIGTLPTVSPSQSVDRVGAARQGKLTPTVGGGGDFGTAPDPVWVGVGFDNGLPTAPKGGRQSPGLPGGAPTDVQSAYKNAQYNQLKAAFNPAGQNAYGAGKGAQANAAAAKGASAYAGGKGGLAPAPQSLPPSPDSSRPASGGTGDGFGLTGGGIAGIAQQGLSSVAGSATAMMPGAGAAGAAMSMGINLGMQEAARAVGYIGQVGGIAASGLLETFGLNDSPLADPSKSLFGRFAGGLAGAHPSKPNTAGMTAPPLQKQEDASAVTNQSGTFGDMNITNNFHGTNDNADQVAKEQNRAMLMYGGGSAAQ